MYRIFSYFLTSVITVGCAAGLAMSNPIPTGSVSGLPNSNQISLSWSAPSPSNGVSVTSYKIEYRQLSLTNSSAVFTEWPIRPTTGNVTITSLNSGAIYEFKITPIDSFGDGPSYLLTLSTLLPPPVNLVINQNDGGLKLSWDSPTSGGSPITDYIVEYRIAGSNAPFVRYNDGTNPNTNASITTLVKGQTYEFRISAYNGAQGLSSSIVTVKVGAVPAQVNNVLVSPSLIPNVTSIVWSAPADNGSPIIDYNIEYKEAGGNSWQIYMHKPSADTTAGLVGLNPSTQYEFRVSAVSANGSGISSGPVIYTTPAKSASPIVPPTNAVINSNVDNGGSSGSMSNLITPGVPGAVDFAPADKSVNGTWIAGLSGACPITDYRTEYKLSTAGDAAWTLYNDGVVNTDKVVVTNLNNDVSYDFRVAAINCKGVGAYTKVYTIIPKANVKACSPIITQYLKKGAANDKENVIRLQTFLKNDEGNKTLTVNGNFGPATYSAVVAFQNKYKSDVLSPWNLSKGTGWVYITTKKKINDLYCQYHQ